ncbi:MAG: hypothetical protein ACMXYG_07465 [Candidatus Woesearchaeota archaeon]
MNNDPKNVEQMITEILDEINSRPDKKEELLENLEFLESELQRLKKHDNDPFLSKFDYDAFIPKKTGLVAMLYLGETIIMGLAHYYMINRYPSLQYPPLETVMEEGFRENIANPSELIDKITPYFLPACAFIGSKIMSITGKLIDNKYRNISTPFFSTIMAFGAAELSNKYGGPALYAAATTFAVFLTTLSIDRDQLFH